jgi:hypothetical protein
MVEDGVRRRPPRPPGQQNDGPREIAAKFDPAGAINCSFPFHIRDKQRKSVPNGLPFAPHSAFKILHSAFTEISVILMIHS